MYEENIFFGRIPNTLPQPICLSVIDFLLTTVVVKKIFDVRVGAQIFCRGRSEYAIPYGEVTTDNIVKEESVLDWLVGKGELGIAQI